MTLKGDRPDTVKARFPVHSCSDCGANVLIIPSPNGWPLLFDPEPTADGKAVIIGGRPTSVITEDVAGRYWLWMPHPWTCAKRGPA